MRAVPTLALVILSAALAGGAGFLGRGWVAGEAGDASSPGAPEAPGRTVVALGRLEPASELVAVGGPAGSRLARLVVKEGDAVAEGAPLAYLDAHAEMAAARDQARSRWKEAEQRRRAETAWGRAAIDEARLKLRLAAEVAPLGIKAQDAEVRRSRAALDKARLDLKRAQKMLDDKAIPRSQYDSAALAVREAEGLLERNEASLDQLRQDREVQMALARAGLRAAEAGLDRARLATQADSLAAAVKLAEARLERTVLRAPLAGRVIKVRTRAGESVGPGPVLQMGDTSVMVAVAEVYETDVRLVRSGQRAWVTSAAFPGRKLPGRVERVSTLVHRNDVLRLDPTADADARVVEARVRLDDGSLASRYNYLQVDVHIAVDGP
jgi:HlyD family secretion protein